MNNYVLDSEGSRCKTCKAEYQKANAIEVSFTDIFYIIYFIYILHYK